MIFSGTEMYRTEIFYDIEYGEEITAIIESQLQKMVEHSRQRWRWSIILVLLNNYFYSYKSDT